MKYSVHISQFRAFDVAVLTSKTFSNHSSITRTQQSSKMVQLTGRGLLIAIVVVTSFSFMIIGMTWENELSTNF